MLIFCLVAEQVAEIKISKIKMMCYTIGFPITATLIMFGLWTDPLLFRPVAIISSILFLGTKSLAVFLHSPELARFSLHLSQVENATEGPLQLLLIQHVWLSGGPFYWDTLLSSLLDIGRKLPHRRPKKPPPGETIPGEADPCPQVPACLPSHRLLSKRCWSSQHYKILPGVLPTLQHCLCDVPHQGHPDVIGC